MPEFPYKCMPSSSNFLPLYRPNPRQFLIALVFFSVLLLWLFWPALDKLNTHYICGISGDAGLYVWLSKTVQKNLSELPWFNTKAFFPYGLSLAWSDNFLLPSLAVSVLHAFGFSYALSFNLLILFCYLLAGLCTWELCFKLTNSQAASLIAAAAFCAYGFLLYHLGHPQLQFTFFLPLAISLCFELISRPDPKLALLLGASVFFCFLCVVYYAIFALLLCATILTSAVFLRPKLWNKNELFRLTFGFCLGLLPILPFVFPYLEAKRAFGGRALYEAYYFSADVLSYLSASPLNWFYSFSSVLSHSEAHLFPGFCVLFFSLLALLSVGGTKKLDRAFLFFVVALSICMLASTQVKFNALKYLCALSLWASIFSFAYLSKRIAQLEKELGFAAFSNRAVLCSLFLSALFFMALSFGPLGNPEKGQPALGVFALAHVLLPGLDAMRATSRAGVVVVLLLVVASAFSIKRLFEQRAKYQRVLTPALLLLVLFENYTLHLPLESESPTPEVIEELKSRANSNDAVIFLPLSSKLLPDGRVASWRDFAIRNVRAMNWSAELPYFLVNGYSGQRSKLMQEFPSRLQNFPDARSLKTLEQIVGLRFIVLDSSFKSLDLNKLPESLKVLKSDSAGYVLLEFSPLTRVDNNLALLLPAFKAGALALELLNLDKKLKAPLPIDVYLDSKPFFAIDMSISEPSETFKLSLPEFEDRLRPARLGFKLPADAQVFLRKRSFSLEK